MNNYTVVLTGCFDADSPEQAAQDFREWLNSGSLSVTVTERETGTTVEVEA